MNNNKSLFEQLVRIKSLMKESKEYLLNESFGVGLLKSIVKGVDDLLVTGKLSDDLADIAKAVGKASDDAAAVLKLREFINTATKSGKGNLVSELADNAIKNMDPTSVKNIDDLEESFIQSAVADGKVGLDELEQLRQTIRANLKVDSQLADLTANIEARIMNRIKKAANDAIAGGGSTASKTINFLDESFESVLARANDVLKLDVPPKSITKEMLESSIKTVDDIEDAYNTGRVSAEVLFDSCLKYGKVVESNLEKITKIGGPVMAGFSGFMTALGKGVAGLMGWIGKNGWKIFKGILWSMLIGAVLYGGYTLLQVTGQIGGVAKSQKCFGDDVTVKCVESIPGYQTLDTAEKIDKLCKIDSLPQKNGTGKLSCDNIAEDSPENIKVKSITYEEAGDKPGKVNKFIFKFGDNTSKTYNADTGAELGGGTAPGPAPSPAPGACTWTTEDQAKTALKGTFSSATDTEIRVDLSACLVYYKPAGFTSEQSYAPGDL